MAEKDKCIIKVEGKLVEVTPEVYYAYFRMERPEHGQEEKKQQHDVFSYDALDNCETVGMEAMPDVSIPSVEEVIMTREIYEQLHRAVDALPREERDLIHAIYFEGKSEREYARILGISQNSTLKRRRKILSKLKKFVGETTIFCDSPAIFSFYRGKLPKKQYFVTSTVLCQRNHKKYRLHPPQGASTVGILVL